MNHPSPTTVAPGTILAGKYRVARVLGQGGMGVVVEAHHIQLDDRVALKFLLPEYAKNKTVVERFDREARAAVKIKSEHVARVSDVGTLDTGAPYMVMEFLEGRDLSSMLEKQGPLPLQDAVGYVIQACEALNEAHSYGIVHRDIKPANLFVARRQDGSPLVKVLDFGISKTTGAGVDGLTKTTATMGSALYMSPEQMRQSSSVDRRTDIYSMGITLFELLAGKQPFYAETLPELCAEVLTGNPVPLPQLRNDLPPAFAPVLERSYARSLDQRYQNITELVFALAPFAPPAVQEIIDRLARMANTAAPRAGQAAPAAAPVNATVMGVYNPPVGGQQYGGNTAGPGGYPPPPMLSATGTSGMTTGTTGVTPPVKKSSPATAILAIVGICAVAGIGGGWYLTQRSKAPSGASTTTQVAADTKTADAPAKPSETAAAKPVDAPTQTVAEAPSGAPSSSASPEASTTTQRPIAKNGQVRPPPPAPSVVVVAPPPPPPPPLTAAPIASWR